MALAAGELKMEQSARERAITSFLDDLDYSTWTFFRGVLSGGPGS